MLKQARWQAEVEVMRQSFPGFIPFKTESGNAGFIGLLSGPRSGHDYTVLLRAKTDDYPEREPAVYIHPRVGNGQCQFDGRLSFSLRWVRTRSTFAGCAIVAGRLLEECDI